MNNGKRPNEKPIEFEESSGNVFADLGLPDAEELLARSKVIGQIHDIIIRDRLTDDAAANMMGIPAADVDTILCGDVEDRYSKKELRLLLSNMQKAVNGSKNGKHKTIKGSRIRR
jgi:predicted XRE-type DNA-binding protein